MSVGDLLFIFRRQWCLLRQVAGQCGEGEESDDCNPHQTEYTSASAQILADVGSVGGIWLAMSSHIGAWMRGLR